MERTIGILVFDGVEEMDFVGPWEVFTAAAEYADNDRVHLISERLDPVTCEKGMRMLPDATISAIDTVNVLLLPGGSGARREVNNKVLVEWLNAVAKSCDWITSVCTGAFLLYGSGLASGRQITTHHDFIEDLRRDGADVVTDRRVVQDGQIVTSGGVMSGIEMSLWLVDQIYGAEVGSKVRNYIAYDIPPRDALPKI